ncbi:coniferyl-alcohol dehydrogenase [Nocardioides fonticola]|uniref:Coniferyl-alcohol dehydrogenase n=1 Tax=Nocardioides fonticola TaxID=450363 RepID=A0ABP7XGS2_9ACTN
MSESTRHDLATAPIVVTGAASGIGRALTEQLLAAGRTVHALDRVACPVDGVPTTLCDLADPAAIAAAVAELPPTIAGLASVAGVPGTADPRVVLLVNLLAPQLLAGHLADRLAEGGAIVNVSSMAAHRNAETDESVEELLAATTVEGIEAWIAARGIGGPAAYDTSKHALNRATQRLAARLVGVRRRALTVSPGPVQTPILGDFRVSMGEESIDRAERAVGRHATADEVAAVVGFALSPQATWVTGIDIPADGGLGAVRAAATAPAPQTAGAPA